MHKELEVNTDKQGLTGYACI